MSTSRPKQAAAAWAGTGTGEAGNLRQVPVTGSRRAPSPYALVSSELNPPQTTSSLPVQTVTAFCRGVSSEGDSIRHVLELGFYASTISHPAKPEMAEADDNISIPGPSTAPWDPRPQGSGHSRDGVPGEGGHVPPRRVGGGNRTGVRAVRARQPAGQTISVLGLGVGRATPGREPRIGVIMIQILVAGS